MCRIKYNITYYLSIVFIEKTDPKILVPIPNI